MMHLIIIQKWRRNMKYQMDKQLSLRMNGVAVQSVFSDIVCFEFDGVDVKKNCLSVFVECLKKKGLSHSLNIIIPHDMVVLLFVLSQDEYTLKSFIVCVHNYHKMRLNESNTCFHSVCLFEMHEKAHNNHTHSFVIMMCL